MGIEFDFSEVDSLAADLGVVPRETIRNARKAVEVTARHVKDDWRQGADRSGLHEYAYSVDYDMKLDVDGQIGAEVGPNLGKRQGSFGFVEEGGVDVKSAPQNAGRDAAKANEADFERGILLAVADLD